MRRQNVDAGYASVDAYIADIVVHDRDETPDLDHLFTPERLAHIDAAMADINAGRSYTTEQANEELAKRRAEWLRNNPR
jgi:hypothetical protein